MTRIFVGSFFLGLFGLVIGEGWELIPRTHHSHGLIFLDWVRDRLSFPLVRSSFLSLTGSRQAKDSARSELVWRRRF